MEGIGDWIVDDISSSIFGGALSGIGAGVFTALTGGTTGESIGAALGGALGGAFLGPIGGALGGMAGKWLGGLFGGSSHDNYVQLAENTLQRRDGEFKAGVGDQPIYHIWSDFMDQGGIKQFQQAYGDLLAGWDTTIDQVATSLGDMGDEWLRKIDQVSIKIGGWGSEHFHNIGELWAAESRKIMIGMSPVINEAMVMAGDAIRGTITSESSWDYLTQERKSAITQQINQRDQINPYGDPETELKKYNAFIQQLRAINDSVAAASEIMKQIDMAVSGKSLTEFEKAWISTNEKFDQLALQLIALGIDVEKYTNLEVLRQQELDKQFTAATKGVQDIIDQHTMTADAFNLKKGMEELQKWYDEQLQILDFLKENRSGFDFGSALNDLNLAMQFVMQDLLEGFQGARGSWQSFFDEMSISDLAPSQSLEAFKRQYEELLGSGLTEELLNFVKSKYLPFLQSYTEGSDDYKDYYAQIMQDLFASDAASSLDVAGMDMDDLADALTKALLAAGQAIAGEGDESGWSLVIDGIKMGEVLANLFQNDPQLINVLLNLIRGRL